MEQTRSKLGAVQQLWAVVSFPMRVRVPTQHGVFALALLVGGVLGVLLTGHSSVEMADVLPPWVPTALHGALAVGGAVGALFGGLVAWLVCRPRRAQRWTVDYPRTRMIGLRGVTQS